MTPGTGPRAGPEPSSAGPELVRAKPEPTSAGPELVRAKPTVSELGIDLAAQAWRRSGCGDGAIEVAFASGGPGSAPGGRAWGGTVGAPGLWILLRVAGDPDRRVLVFDRHEWECFLDGARNGEFDDAAAAD